MDKNSKQSYSESITRIGAMLIFFDENGVLVEVSQELSVESWEAPEMHSLTC